LAKDRIAEVFVRWLIVVLDVLLYPVGISFFYPERSEGSAFYILLLKIVAVYIFFTSLLMNKGYCSTWNNNRGIRAFSG